MSSPTLKHTDVKIRVAALISILACCTTVLPLLMFGHRFIFRNPYIQPPIPTSIWMSPDELNLLVKYLKRDVANYLEWGSGGSTEHFPRFVSGRYVSIEHDIAWCDKMKSRLASMDMFMKKVELRCI